MARSIRTSPVDPLKTPLPNPHPLLHPQPLLVYPHPQPVLQPVPHGALAPTLMSSPIVILNPPQEMF